MTDKKIQKNKSDGQEVASKNNDTARHHRPTLRFPDFSDDWEEKKLGEVSEITTGKLDANAMKENGKYRFYTCAKDFYQIDKFTFDTEALLISGNGANVGYIHYYNGKFNAYQRTYVLDKFSQNIIYIKFFLDKALKNRIKREKKEGNTPYIVMGTLFDMKINLPQLPEQEKIASFLTAVDEWVGNLKEQKAEMENYKKGIMQQIFPAKDQSQPTLRFPDFSDDWEEKKLGEIGSIKTGTTPPTKDKENYDGEYLWVTPTDINNGKNIVDTAKKLSEVGLKKGRIIEKNSLLVTCIASIGKNTILRTKGSCNQQINTITPDYVNNVDFLYYLIEQSKNKLLSYAGGGGMLILNKTDFSKIKFLFPQLPEQEKIASFLSSLDDIINSTEQKITKAENWKKGLMQKMFV